MKKKKNEPNAQARLFHAKLASSKRINQILQNYQFILHSIILQ